MKSDWWSPDRKQRNMVWYIWSSRVGGTQGEGVAGCIPSSVGPGTSLRTQGAVEHSVETTRLDCL